MKCLVLCIGVLAMAFGASAATKYRDFTSADGKTIKAAVKAYDAQKSIVTIERDNRKTMKVPITVFSEADQSYILEWAVLRNFALERLFKISVKRKKNDNEEESFTSGNKKKAVVDTHYEILLENKTSSDLKGLKLEYCIYYEQETPGQSKMIRNQGVYCGDLAIDSIASGSKKVLDTESVTTYTEELDSGWYYFSGSGNIQRGDVHGIWIRVHLKLPSGQTRTREMCYPDSLSNSKAWMTSSIKAGAN